MSDKITIATLIKKKSSGQPVSMLTSYDVAMAQLSEKAGVDSLLVGDSLAQVVLGMDSTLPVEMDLMIALTAAVRRGAPNVYLVGDMPFLSYQVSEREAILNAGRFMKEAGCDAVKLEVDERHLGLVAALSRANIPVMAHLGLKPQSIHQMGHYRCQGKTASEAIEIVHIAQDILAAGACSILLECVTSEVGKAVSEITHYPVIGCGGGAGCDGQVLVLHDLLDLPGAGNAKFTKAYGQISEPILTAMRNYVHEVQSKKFPDASHSYHMSEDEKRQFEQELSK